MKHKIFSSAATTIMLLILVLIISMTAMPSASAHTCAISPSINQPLMPDTDCDGVPDEYDNCAYITNPMQRDAEGNGLGDACDLYIESITTSPADFVYNTRAFNSYVTIYNNREYNIRNLKIRLIMPELGIESVRYIDNLEVCSAETIEFFLRAPQCVPMYDYKIIVEASFMNIFSEQETIPGISSIRVVPDKYCQSVLMNNQSMGNTFIDVMEIQDVYKGSEAVFPIRISNREFNDKEYVFSVTGLDNWGEARFEPGTLIIVPAESERTTDLYVAANDNVAPGERVFVVSVKSGEEVQRFLLIANVKESDSIDPSIFWFFTIKVVLIAGLIILLLAGAYIGIRKYLKSTRPAPVKSGTLEYY